jgi:hypothetical protein
MTSRILALDLATATGFACGSIDEGIVEHGTHRMPKTGEDVGLFLAHFREWLSGVTEHLQPWTIFFEAPVLPGRDKTSLITLRKLYSLAGLTELVAHDRQIDCREANASDITTHFIGKGAPRYGQRRKDATMQKCRDRGWTFVDENDADALALLDYALSLLKPERAIEATPLFALARTA